MRLLFFIKINKGDAMDIRQTTEINKSNNVFDFLICIYGFISENMSDAIRESKARKDDPSYMEIYNEISSSIRVLDKHCFSEWRSIWIKTIEKKHECFSAECLDTLICFDNLYFTNRKTVTGKSSTAKCGPLNNYSEQGFYFYLSPPRTLIADSMEKNRIIKGRKTLEPDPGGLKLNNYMIVRKDSLSGYTPKVNIYRLSRNNPSFESETLNAVIVPFFNEPWFGFNIDSSTLEFSIISSSEYNTIINEAMLNIIIESDKNGQNIIVFPEMSMNDDTLTYMKKNLLYHKLNNIKLIFLGSHWSSNSNTAYVLSKEGTELLTYSKKQPFEYFDKDTNSTYREGIKSTQKTIDYIDIEGIGRISYVICRDFTDVTIDYICVDIMQSFLSVISAFSPKVDIMEEQAVATAASKYRITILCNACSSLKQSGFFAQPSLNEKKRKIFTEIENEEHCSKCTYCSCIKSHSFHAKMLDE